MESTAIRDGCEVTSIHPYPIAAPSGTVFSCVILAFRLRAGRNLRLSRPAMAQPAGSRLMAKARRRIYPLAPFQRFDPAENVAAELDE